MSNIKATIIILDYMKGARVVANVKSILQQQVGFNIKIIVIDNSCNANNAAILKTLTGLPNVSVRINNENLGYIKAHNSVKDEVEGEYVMIVNPDIIWKESDTIKKMIEYMDEHKDIGIIGPKQINETDGQPAMTIRAFPRFYLQVARRTFLRNLPIISQKVSFDEMQHLNYDKIQDVDWLQSSCVVVRTELWNKAGGLSENYFLFMSDVELCWQSWKNGMRVVYYPLSIVYADGKRASAGGFSAFFKSWVLRQHVVDSLKYRTKHFFDRNPRQEYYRNNNI
jgi:N-acetylglucosaminyl-diphospho-decaprenol L-rhamnosyltransferase